MEEHGHQQTESNQSYVSINPAADNQSSELIITDLIRPGKKGVTNFQMILAIRNAIKVKSVGQLILLKMHYPKVFANSMRYWKKK